MFQGSSVLQSAPTLVLYLPKIQAAPVPHVIEHLSCLYLLVMNSTSENNTSFHLNNCFFLLENAGIIL